MTYMSMYLAHLEERLAAGGAEDAVMAAVAEYNNPTRDGVSAWLAATQIDCSTCGKPFCPDNPDIEKEPTCQTCSTNSTPRP